MSAPKPIDYDYEERAAIVEYDAKVPKAEAERLAREMEQRRTAQEAKQAMSDPNTPTGLEGAAKYLRIEASWYHPESVRREQFIALADAIDAAQQTLTAQAEQIAALREALKQFAECNLNDSNCASWAVANRRIRSIAKRALAEAPHV